MVFKLIQSAYITKVIISKIFYQINRAKIIKVGIFLQINLLLKNLEIGQVKQKTKMHQVHFRHLLVK